MLRWDRKGWMVVLGGNHWALHFGESGPGKTPAGLSPDKTGSCRSRCERPWGLGTPGNYFRELESVLASLCALVPFGHPLWASLSSPVRWREEISTAKDFKIKNYVP